MTAKRFSAITPDWPAPANVVAACTTRNAGFSDAPFGSLNPASHVGDNVEKVTANRSLIRQELLLPADPCWLNQTHGDKVFSLVEDLTHAPEADASITEQINKVCVVQTADCLPVLMCDQQGQQVAAVHAGWRSLAAGIVPKTASLFHASPEQLLIWLGPAISAQHFEVGLEVKNQFLQLHADNERAFTPSVRSGHSMADLYLLAKIQLQQLGIKQIFGGDYCTYADSERFYSYRRDGQTGRMASLIYRKR